jgi:DNA-directed RNA polymerase specialized sigma24 family protein
MNESALSDRERVALLRVLLTPLQAEVLRLYLLGHKYMVIAKDAGVPLCSLARCLQRIRKHYKRCGLVLPRRIGPRVRTGTRRRKEVAA